MKHNLICLIRKRMFGRHIPKVSKFILHYSEDKKKKFVNPFVFSGFCVKSSQDVISSSHNS